AGTPPLAPGPARSNRRPSPSPSACPHPPAPRPAPAAAPPPSGPSTPAKNHAGSASTTSGKDQARMCLATDHDDPLLAPPQESALEPRRRDISDPWSLASGTPVVD